MFKKRFAVAFVLNGVEASPSAVTIHRISPWEVLHHLHLEEVSFCLFSKLHPGENRCLYVGPSPTVFLLTSTVTPFRREELMHVKAMLPLCTTKTASCRTPSYCKVISTTPSCDGGPRGLVIDSDTAYILSRRQWRKTRVRKIVWRIQMGYVSLFT